MSNTAPAEEVVQEVPPPSEVPPELAQGAPELAQAEPPDEERTSTLARLSHASQEKQATEKVEERVESDQEVPPELAEAEPAKVERTSILARISRTSRTEEQIIEKAEEQAERESDKARKKRQIEQAKLNAERRRPPKDARMFASCTEMGNKFGVGIGLYFKVLEWLLILFACITFLAIPFWIVINTSVFTDEANKDSHEFGVKIYEEPSLLSSTFAAIVDQRVDPNTTLTWMNTKLGTSWYGPMKKNDFLLWISLLDVVGVVLGLILVSVYTWKARKFENDVDTSTIDITDYAVLVHGLPKHAGVHEVGQFFSKFGEVMDVTLLLDMSKVLRACAKASELESKRELQATQQLTTAQRERLAETDEELREVLLKINEDMNKHIIIRDREIAKAKEKMARRALRKGRKAAARGDKDAAEAVCKELQLEREVEEDDTIDLEQYNAGCTLEDLSKEAVYDTKLAFVTFNRMSEQQKCLKECPDLGWAGWLYGRSAATDSQLMRDGKYVITTHRAGSPTDYIFENMTVRPFVRFLHLLFTRTIILIILIVCAICVTGLSTIEVLERENLNWATDAMRLDIGRAGAALSATSPAPEATNLLSAFEAAMRDAAGTPGGVPAFTPALARQANFTDFCSLALPDVCAAHYREEFDVSLSMRWGLHFIWGRTIDRLLNQRPILASMVELAKEEDPLRAEGADRGLSSCLACYCLGLNRAQAGEAASTLNAAGNLDSNWLSQTQTECEHYLSAFDIRSWGTRVAVSIVIAVINISLKLVVQFLGRFEMHWTQSNKERSFAVVAFVAQLLNTVLVLLLVNARPAANATAQGDRVGEDDIQWLRYILLSGRFDDFSPQWYQFVGVSIMSLLFIQTIFPLVNVGLEMLIKGVKLLILATKRRAPQGSFDSAYEYPKFLLQQRVADVMLNVSVAMMFSSGMPLCAGVVCLVFSVAILVDRFALTRLMSVTSYGSQLPRLVLGLLPWAVFFHCLFGLWQHTYFMLDNVDNETTALFIRLGRDEAGNTRAEGSFFGEFIDARGVLSRISQPNGFGLLLCAFLMFLWLLLRYIFLVIILPFVRRWVRKTEERNAATGGGAMGASRLRLARKLMAMPAVTAFPGLEPVAKDFSATEPEVGGTDPRDPTFEEALTCSNAALRNITKKKRITRDRLQRLPTYRLSYQPEYAAVFRGLLHSAILLKMNGPERFTRLVPVRDEVHAQEDRNAPPADGKPSDAVKFMDNMKEPSAAAAPDKDAHAPSTFMKAGSLPRMLKDWTATRVRWTVSQQLILSAGDMDEAGQVALKQAYNKRGLGSLADHVASMVTAASQGSHTRKSSKVLRLPGIENPKGSKPGAARTRMGPAADAPPADAAAHVEAPCGPTPADGSATQESHDNPLGEMPQPDSHGSQASLRGTEATETPTDAPPPEHAEHSSTVKPEPEQLPQQPRQHVHPQQSEPQPQQTEPQPQPQPQAQQTAGVEGRQYPAVVPPHPLQQPQGPQYPQQQQPGTAYLAVLPPAATPQQQQQQQQYPAVLPQQQQQQQQQYPAVLPHKLQGGGDVRYPRIQP